MATAETDFAAELARIKQARVVRSFCYTCPWQCPTEVYVRDGRIVYHKGNSRAPNNIGSRCAKGMASGWVVQNPDRLKYPMLRTNPKGEPVHGPVLARGSMPVRAHTPAAEAESLISRLAVEAERNHRWRRTDECVNPIPSENCVSAFVESVLRFGLSRALQ